MSDWRTDVLRSMGAPITPQNLNFLQSWQRWEGGHTNNSATYNWLNTTHGAGTPINAVGVKAFPSYQAGVQNTVATLTNGRYSDIITGLRSGNPYNHNVSAGLSTWVSGSPTGNLAYAAKVMGSPYKGGGTNAAPSVPPTTPSLQRPRQSIGLNPQTMAIFGSARSMDPREQTRSILGALLQGDPLTPLVGRPRSRRLAAHQSVSPTGGAPVSGYSGADFLAAALGGAKYSNLGGPSAHQARALGNWQSDNAWDLGVPVGTPVYAVADGVVGPNVGVQASRPQDGARFTLVGPGNQWWYGHLSKLLVKPGQKVKRGQIVGYSGASQNGAAHLHLGVMNP